MSIEIELLRYVSPMEHFFFWGGGGESGTACIYLYP